MEEKECTPSAAFWIGVITGIIVALVIVGAGIGLYNMVTKSGPEAGAPVTSVSQIVQQPSPSAQPKGSAAVPSEQPAASTDPQPQATPEPSAEPDSTSAEGSAAEKWDPGKVYNGGEIVSYNGKIYKCRWWTQNEQPGAVEFGPWEDMMIADSGAADAKQPENVSQVPVDATVPANSDASGFKVVGYYPSWAPDQLNKVDFNVLTHVNYAFAIPNADGTIKPLENPETAKKLIESAHKNGAKVLIAVGGWSYNGTPLEPTFISATETPEKREKFVSQLVALCSTYGFDGVDMDWEHPRVDGNSAAQYEATLQLLKEQLSVHGWLLTSAVLSGATADGNIYYDAAAHTNAALNCVDWINIMAYDGGDGERHSSYDFALNSAAYWKDTRGLPAEKVVLGVPFYARPSWAAYGKILEADPEADQKDVSSYNGMEAHYNGVETMQKKAAYAKENLGGIMIWELTQDTSNPEKSLLQAIGKTVK